MLRLQYTVHGMDKVFLRALQAFRVSARLRNRSSDMLVGGQCAEIFCLFPCFRLWRDDWLEVVMILQVRFLVFTLDDRFWVWFAGLEMLPCHLSSSHEGRCRQLVKDIYFFNFFFFLIYSIINPGEPVAPTSRVSDI